LCFKSAEAKQIYWLRCKKENPFWSAEAYIELNVTLAAVTHCSYVL